MRLHGTNKKDHFCKIGYQLLGLTPVSHQDFVVVHNSVGLHVHNWYQFYIIYLIMYSGGSRIETQGGP